MTVILRALIASGEAISWEVVLNEGLPEALLSSLLQSPYLSALVLSFLRGDEPFRILSIREYLEDPEHSLEMLMVRERGGDSSLVHVKRLPEPYSEIIKLNTELANHIRQMSATLAELKENNERLIKQISDVALELSALLRGIAIKQRETEELANRDPLTGAYNRRYLSEELLRRLCFVEPDLDRVVYVIMDLDGFKAINDKFGHARGDEVLRTFASEVMGQIREGKDFLVRMGGDEFLLVLCGVDEGVAKQILRRLEERLAQKDIRFSWGMLCGRELSGKGFDEIYREIDRAMYEMKGAKR